MTDRDFDRDRYVDYYGHPAYNRDLAPAGHSGYRGETWDRRDADDAVWRSGDPNGRRWEGPYRGRGPRGYRRSDGRIGEDVNDRLTEHGQIDATDIEVSIENGEVTLTGTVDSRRTKRLAEDVAESVTGVLDVHNRLRVRQQQAAETTAAQ